MQKLACKFEREGYAVMRITMGVLFWCHGLQKVFGVFEGRLPPMFSLSWIAGVIELVTGLMMAVGYFTAPAAFISSGLMAVAYFMIHFAKGFWPIENHGELAVVYCFVFLYMASRGSGVWSLEVAMKRTPDTPSTDKWPSRKRSASSA